MIPCPRDFAGVAGVTTKIKRSGVWIDLDKQKDLDLIWEAIFNVHSCG